MSIQYFNRGNSPLKTLISHFSNESNKEKKVVQFSLPAEQVLIKRMHTIHNDKNKRTFMYGDKWGCLKPRNL